jgi:hypothetical protein
LYKYSLPIFTEGPFSSKWFVSRVSIIWTFYFHRSFREQYANLEFFFGGGDHNCIKLYYISNCSRRLVTRFPLWRPGFELGWSHGIYGGQNTGARFSLSSSVSSAKHSTDCSSTHTSSSSGPGTVSHLMVSLMVDSILFHPKKKKKGDTLHNWKYYGNSNHATCYPFMPMMHMHMRSDFLNK